MSLILVLSIAVFGFVLMIIANSLDTSKVENVPLQIFIYFFVVLSLLLLGKAGLDSKTVCEPVVNYTTVTGNTTNFYFSDFCYERAENTGRTFYKLSMWFIWVFYIYTFIVFLMKIYQAIMIWWKQK